MSILIKDFVYETITTTSGSTAASDSYTTTEQVYDTSDWRIITEDGRLTIDYSKAPKGIYSFPLGPFTISQAELVAYLTGKSNLDAGDISYFWRQIYYWASKSLHGYYPGKPIYTLPYGYLAFWYGIAGFGVYLFIGYDAPTSQPSQTVTYSTDPLMNSVISDVMESGVESDIAELMSTLYDPTGLLVLTMADGYTSNTSLYEDLYSQIPSTTNTLPSSTTDPTTAPTATVTTTMPAQDAYVGESTGLTYTELLKLTNAGWNSWARSIDQLSLGTYIVYTVATGVTSACVGVGPKGIEGDGIGRFTHSIIADRDGVKIYESGQLKTTLYNSQVELTQLRIYRMADNSIVYVATTGADTQVYTSLVAAPSKATPIYAYGYLFIASDKVTTARYRTGEVQYGSV